MEYFMNNAPLRPKRVMYVLATSNQFTNNKIDVSKFTVRSLIYIPKTNWYIKDEELNRFDDNEFLTDNDRSNFLKQANKYIIKMHADFEKLVSLYNPVTKYLVINDSLKIYTASLKFAAEECDYVTIDLNPIGKDSFNSLEDDQKKLTSFTDRLRVHLRFHHSEITEPEPLLSPESVYDPFGDR